MFFVKWFGVSATTYYFTRDLLLSGFAGFVIALVDSLFTNDINVTVVHA